MQTEATIEELQIHGYRDPIWFLRTTLPHLFQMEIPWFWRAIIALVLKRTDFLPQYGELDRIVENFVYDLHGQKQPLFALTDDGIELLPRAKNLLVMVPRGHGKTTTIGVGLPIFLICYLLEDFIVYVSESAPHAQMQLRNVRNELSGNEYIRTLFGEIAPERNEAKKWTDNLLEVRNGVVVAARGKGAQIRGMNHGGKRPSLILCDDLQSEDDVRSPTQLKNDLDWLLGSVEPALSHDPGSGLILLGTYLGPGCIVDAIHNLAVSTPVGPWVSVRLSAPLWDGILSTEDFEAKKVYFESLGRRGTFFREYANMDDPSPESHPFTPDMITHDDRVPGQVISAMFCDPAISENRSADDCAIVVWSLSYDRGLLWKRYEWGGRGVSTDELCDEFLRIHKLFNVKLAGFESNGYQKSIESVMRAKMFKHKHYFEIKAVCNHKSKHSRILGILEPFYRAGMVRHCGRFKSEQQLLTYDRSRGAALHDDYIDADASCIELFNVTAAVYGGEATEANLKPYTDAQIAAQGAMY